MLEVNILHRQVAEELDGSKGQGTIHRRPDQDRGRGSFDSFEHLHHKTIKKKHNTARDILLQDAELPHI